MSASILRETAAWLAVDKPPGQAVVPARGEEPGDSLWRTLERARGERLWAVHRLDRNTSGVVLFARDAAAHRALSMAFEQRAVHKTYLAFTRGAPPADAGVIDAPLHPARRGKMRPAAPGEAGALAAETAYRVLRRWQAALGDVALGDVAPRDAAPRDVALIEAQPRTGRHHQIRVHLRFVGAPLLVDPSYGRGEPVSAAVAGGEVVLARLGLHASRLVFPAPDTGEAITVDAPLPADLQALMQALDARRRQ